MTIASTTNRMPNYVGNGSTDEFSYTFKIFTDGDLLVTVRNTSNVETTLVLNTDYTVAGAGDSDGGSITLVNASQAWLTGGFLTTNYEITMRRVVSVIQETDIRNQGSFFPETHEDAFDYLTMIDQQQEDVLDRSMKLPESVAGSTFDTMLPATIVGASNSVLVVNATGDGFDVGSDIADLAALDAAYAGTTANVVAAAASAAAAAASAASAVAAANLVAIATFTGNRAITIADKAKILEGTPTAACNLTLPNPTVVATGFYFWVKDVTGVFGSFPVTFVRFGSELLENLAADYVAEANFGIWKVYTDGTNWKLS